MSIYPTAIPTIAQVFDYTDDVDWMNAAKWTVMRNELIAGLTELGVLPKGSSASVAERIKGIKSLSDADADIINIKGSKVGIGTAAPSEALDLASGNLITTGTGLFGGVSNTKQLIVKANASQSNSNPLIELQDSGGNPLFGIHSDSDNNIFIGNGTGASNVYVDQFDGGTNIFIGYQAGTANVGGASNIAIGKIALASNIEGDGNFALGAEAMYANTGGNSNVAIGFQALGTNLVGNANMAIGAQSLLLTTGNNNVAIGQYAGLFTAGSGGVFIGNSAGMMEGGSNKLYIANTNTATPLIYGEFDNNLVKIHDYLYLPNIKSGATQVAAAAAAGELWKTNGHVSLPDNVLMIGV